MSNLTQNAGADAVASLDGGRWEYQATLDAGRALAKAVADAEPGDLKVIRDKYVYANEEYGVYAYNWCGDHSGHTRAQAKIADAIGLLVDSTKLWKFMGWSLHELHEIILERRVVPEFETSDAAFLKPLVARLVEGVR